jgi:DNA primase
MAGLASTEIIKILGPAVRVDRVMEERISLFCPFHKGGQERKASMSIYLDTGFVVCFTCGYRKFLDKFLVDRGMSEKVARQYSAMLKQTKPRELVVLPREYDIAAWVGTFRGYYPRNLLEDGPTKFTRETLDRFQVGYDTRYQRVTYPIHDRYGMLVAIVGGATDPEDHPKYKLYYEEINIPQGTSQGHRSHLWGFHLMGDTPWYVIVEGYKACMAVAQAGITNVCATQGTMFTPAQVKIIKDDWRPVKIFYDNDEAGIAAGLKLQRELLPVLGTRVSRVEYPRDDAKQPDWLTPAELCQLLKEETV